MAKTNKKLSLKKETLRSLQPLTEAELGHVGGGGYILVPPKGTGGCDTTGCLQAYDFQALYAFYY